MTDNYHDSISEPHRILSKSVSFSWIPGVVADVVAKILNDGQRKVSNISRPHTTKARDVEQIL